VDVDVQRLVDDLSGVFRVRLASIPLVRDVGDVLESVGLVESKVFVKLVFKDGEVFCVRKKK
jgi:hypothetical protein